MTAQKLLQQVSSEFEDEFCQGLLTNYVNFLKIVLLIMGKQANKHTHTHTTKQNKPPQHTFSAPSVIYFPFFFGSELTLFLAFSLFPPNVFIETCLVAFHC